MDTNRKYYKEFEIPFSGLKDGKHEFKFDLDSRFFELFSEQEINNGELKAEVELIKSTTMLQFKFIISGIVRVNCYRCNDSLSIPVETNNTLYVKFGDRQFEETDEIIIIPHSEYKFQIADYLYEFISLSLPLGKSHEIEDCNQEVIEQLEAFVNNKSEEENNDIDPRWNKLKNLK